MIAQDVTATFGFLEWQELYTRVKPYELFVDIPEGVEGLEMTNCIFTQKEVHVKDLRGSEADLSLNDQGFIYIKHRTCLTNEDLQSRERVEQIYYPQMEALLRKEVEEVDQVHFFDWRIRKHQPQPQAGPLDLNDRTVYLRPAIEMHVDQSPAAVVKRVQLQFGDEAERLLQGRVRIIKYVTSPLILPNYIEQSSVWRPLVDMVEDWPLALCDGRSIASSDLVETDNVRKHYTGSTMYTLYNPEQKWYYLNKQSREEVTIFKTFDSADFVASRATPHGSFQMPQISSDAKPRVSIEVRAMVFTHC
ncbi:hypothetical protein F5882DRAFT_165356 [Hyaloscypha sp. PMI_1271]|nr:hypothetical protein F5882DRAFT_165356 [Hyaloscypha sp. PMI_1271]